MSSTTNPFSSALTLLYLAGNTQARLLPDAERQQLIDELGALIVDCEGLEPARAVLADPKARVDLILIECPAGATELDLAALAGLRRAGRPAVLLLSQLDLAAQAWQAGFEQVILCGPQQAQLNYLAPLLSSTLGRARSPELAWFEALMTDMPDSIYFKDRECRLLRVSRKMLNNLGVAEMAQIAGQTDMDLFGEEFGRRAMSVDREILESGQAVIGMIESRRLPGGRVNWTSTSKVPVRNAQGEILGLMGITREINELKQAELDLQYLATHDYLTHLPNRFLMEDRLQQALAMARRHDRCIALLFIDIDNFKPINDQFGHRIGDRLLEVVGERLRDCTRESDTLARLGGDEFVLILESICSDKDIDKIAGKVCTQLGQPYPIQGHSLHITVSIGISRYPTDGLDAHSLVEAADCAMYRSKHRGGNCFSFFSEMC